MTHTLLSVLISEAAKMHYLHLSCDEIHLLFGAFGHLLTAARHTL